MTAISFDSHLYTEFLGPDQAATVFHQLRDEVPWTTMMHKGGQVPRLVALQFAPGEGDCVPVYRHPIDQEPPASPFSPTVDMIRLEIQARFGLQLNHCLIQLYRSGHDFIGEHSDKTLDIARGTPIVNYSAGATRQLVLRSKRDGQGQRGPSTRVELVHDSLFVLGWRTNMVMTHAIRQDKRALAEKRPDELLENGERISLTFRNIATFRIVIDGIHRLFGQGARCKTRQALLLLLQDSTPKASDEDEQERRLLAAFTAENRQADFDWDQHYANGFDIVTVNINDQTGG